VLHRAGGRFAEAGYEVQTLRIATQPLPEYAGRRSRAALLEALTGLDAAATEARVLFNPGPVITADRHDQEFAPWAAELVSATRSTNFSVTVASEETGIHRRAARSAAEAMVAIAAGTSGGEGNFSFTAAANCPPGIPFFPAAYHRGAPSLAIGLESPPLLQETFRDSGGREGGRKGGHGGNEERRPEVDFEAARSRLKARLETELAPVAKLASEFAADAGRRYLGIDVSPAPGKDASIGEAIETLTGVPFGSASTLSACAAITDVLKSLELRTCGYSGLMLPVLEDPVLARRAAEDRYGVRELLLYSSVCGTGLDVVPLPGDTPATTLAALIGDVAAMSIKLHKPLSARLFPVPGKCTGEAVHFENPFLTDSVVLALE